MNLNDYQKKARDTAVYPTQPVNTGLMYCVLGLAGEAGEVANKTSKILRDDGSVVSVTRAMAIKKELGDTLWYLANTCHELGYTLESVAEDNLKKLAERKERGMIHGDGDTR